MAYPLSGTRSISRYFRIFPLLRVFVFDCDGVIFDSKAANVRFYNHILEKFGYPPVRVDQWEYIHTHSAQESLKYLIEDKVTAEKAWEYCRQMDYSPFNRYLKVEAGIFKLLTTIRKEFNMKTALATNRTVSTWEVLSWFGLRNHFDLVVTAADVNLPKPHPEIMERVLDVFRVSPKQVLYIGDSSLDQQVAEATGVYFAAYKNPMLKCHFHIESFDQLLGFLRKAARKEGRGSDRE